MNATACFAHLTRHTEVAELAMPVRIQQKVAALYVPVNELLAVQVLQRFCPLYNKKNQGDRMHYNTVIFAIFYTLSYMQRK